MLSEIQKLSLWPTQPKTIRLADGERTQILEAAKRLQEQYRTVDNAELRNRGNVWAVRCLPDSLLMTLADLVADPGFDQYGALIVDNFIPVDQVALGPTPARWQQVNREQLNLYEIASLLLHGALQSRLIRFRYQRDGKDFCHSVIPDEKEAGQQTGSEPGKIDLAFHTEDLPLSEPAQWITFLFLRNEEHAPSHLTSIRSIDIQSLEFGNLLFQPLFPCPLDANYRNRTDVPLISDQPIPVLFGNQRFPFIRFDPVEQVQKSSGAIRKALEELEDALKNRLVSYVPTAGSVVILNNRVTLHGRGKFDAGVYNGQKVERRWMLRTMSGIWSPDRARMVDPNDPALSLELMQGRLFH